MKIFKKIIVCLLVAVMLGGISWSFIGCGKKETPSEDNGQQEQSADQNNSTDGNNTNTEEEQPSGKSDITSGEAEELLTGSIKKAIASLNSANGDLTSLELISGGKNISVYRATYDFNVSYQNGSKKDSYQRYMTVSYDSNAKTASKVVKDKFNNTTKSTAIDYVVDSNNNLKTFTKLDNDNSSLAYSKLGTNTLKNISGIEDIASVLNLLVTSEASTMYQYNKDASSFDARVNVLSTLKDVRISGYTENDNTYITIDCGKINKDYDGVSIASLFNSTGFVDKLLLGGLLNGSGLFYDRALYNTDGTIKSFDVKFELIVSDNTIKSVSISLIDESNNEKSNISLTVSLDSTATPFSHSNTTLVFPYNGKIVADDKYSVSLQDGAYLLSSFSDLNNPTVNDSYVIYVYDNGTKLIYPYDMYETTETVNDEIQVLSITEDFLLADDLKSSVIAEINGTYVVDLKGAKTVYNYDSDISGDSGITLENPNEFSYGISEQKYAFLTKLNTNSGLSNGIYYIENNQEFGTYDDEVTSPSYLYVNGSTATAVIMTESGAEEEALTIISYPQIAVLFSGGKVKYYITTEGDDTFINSVEVLDSKLSLYGSKLKDHKINPIVIDDETSISERAMRFALYLHASIVGDNFEESANYLAAKAAYDAIHGEGKFAELYGELCEEEEQLIRFYLFAINLQNAQEAVDAEIARAEEAGEEYNINNVRTGFTLSSDEYILSASFVENYIDNQGLFQSLYSLYIADENNKFELYWDNEKTDYDYVAIADAINSGAIVIEESDIDVDAYDDAISKYVDDVIAFYSNFDSILKDNLDINKMIANPDPELSDQKPLFEKIKNLIPSEYLEDTESYQALFIVYYLGSLLANSDESFIALVDDVLNPGFEMYANYKTYFDSVDSFNSKLKLVKYSNVLKTQSVHGLYYFDLGTNSQLVNISKDGQTINITNIGGEFVVDNNSIKLVVVDVEDEYNKTKYTYTIDLGSVYKVGDTNDIFASLKTKTEDIEIIENENYDPLDEESEEFIDNVVDETISYSPIILNFAGIVPANLEEVGAYIETQTNYEYDKVGSVLLFERGQDKFIIYINEISDGIDESTVVITNSGMNIISPIEGEQTDHVIYNSQTKTLTIYCDEDKQTFLTIELLGKDLDYVYGYVTATVVENSENNLAKLYGIFNNTIIKISVLTLQDIDANAKLSGILSNGKSFSTIGFNLENEKVFYTENCMVIKVSDKYYAYSLDDKGAYFGELKAITPNSTSSSVETILTDGIYEFISTGVREKFALYNNKANSVITSSKLVYSSGGLYADDVLYSVCYGEVIVNGTNYYLVSENGQNGKFALLKKLSGGQDVADASLDELLKGANHVTLKDASGNTIEITKISNNTKITINGSAEYSVFNSNVGIFVGAYKPLGGVEVTLNGVDSTYEGYILQNGIEEIQLLKLIRLRNGSYRIEAFDGNGYFE